MLTHRSWFEENDVPIAMSDLACRGADDTLYDCPARFLPSGEMHKEGTHKRDIWLHCDYTGEN